MKVKVVRVFKDKLTGSLRKIDDEFDVTKERFEEINSTALGVFVKEIKDPNKKVVQNTTSSKKK